MKGQAWASWRRHKEAARALGEGIEAALASGEGAEGLVEALEGVYAQARRALGLVGGEAVRLERRQGAVVVACGGGRVKLERREGVWEAPTLGLRGRALARLLASWPSLRVPDEVPPPATEALARLRALMLDPEWVDFEALDEVLLGQGAVGVVQDYFRAHLGRWPEAQREAWQEHGRARFIELGVGLLRRQIEGALVKVVGDASRAVAVGERVAGDAGRVGQGADREDAAVAGAAESSPAGSGQAAGGAERVGVGVEGLGEVPEAVAERLEGALAACAADWNRAMGTSAGFELTPWYREPVLLMVIDTRDRAHAVLGWDGAGLGVLEASAEVPTDSALSALMSMLAREHDPMVEPDEYDQFDEDWDTYDMMVEQAEAAHARRWAGEGYVEEELDEVGPWEEEGNWRAAFVMEGLQADLDAGEADEYAEGEYEGSEWFYPRRHAPALDAEPAYDRDSWADDEW